MGCMLGIIVWVCKLWPLMHPVIAFFVVERRGSLLFFEALQ